MGKISDLTTLVQEVSLLQFDLSSALIYGSGNPKATIGIHAPFKTTSYLALTFLAFLFWVSITKFKISNRLPHVGKNLSVAIHECQIWDEAVTKPQTLGHKVGNDYKEGFCPHACRGITLPPICKAT